MADYFSSDKKRYRYTNLEQPAIFAYVRHNKKGYRLVEYEKYKLTVITKKMGERLVAQHSHT